MSYPNGRNRERLYPDPPLVTYECPICFQGTNLFRYTDYFDVEAAEDRFVIACPNRSHEKIWINCYPNSRVANGRLMTKAEHAQRKATNYAFSRFKKMHLSSDTKKGKRWLGKLLERHPSDCRMSDMSIENLDKIMEAVVSACPEAEVHRVNGYLEYVHPEKS